MTNQPSPFSRGDIVRVALDPVIGSEQGKMRPCIIVQRESANRTSPTTIVCPIADAAGRRANLLNVEVVPGKSGLTKVSLILCNQIRTIDRRRIVARLGNIDANAMQRVEDGLRAILGLDE